jgi:hypothetical protein
VAFYAGTRDVRDAPGARALLDAAAPPSDAELGGFSAGWRVSRDAQVAAIEALARDDAAAAAAAIEDFESTAIFDCDATRVAPLYEALELVQLRSQVVATEDLGETIDLAMAIERHPGMHPTDQVFLTTHDPRAGVDDALSGGRLDEAASALEHIAAHLQAPSAAARHWVNSRLYRLDILRLSASGASPRRELSSYEALPGNTDEDRRWLAAHTAGTPARRIRARGHLAVLGGMLGRLDDVGGTGASVGLSLGAEVDLAGPVLSAGILAPDLGRFGGAVAPGASAPTLSVALGGGYAVARELGALTRLAVQLRGRLGLVPTVGTDGDDLMLGGAAELVLTADLLEDRLRVEVNGGSGGVLHVAGVDVSGVIPASDGAWVRLGVALGSMSARPVCDCVLADVDWLWAAGTVGVVFR